MTGGRAEPGAAAGFLRQLFGGRLAEPPAVGPPLAADPIAEATLLALQRNAIRPTPEAYTIWYRHLAGERPDLSRRLKELEALGEPFDAVLIAELFERYFGIEGEILAVAEAGQAIERLLAALAADMAMVGADAAARGERLDRLGGTVASAAGDDRGAPAAAPLPATLRRALAALVDEVRSMRGAALRLERRVVESAGEIAQLRAMVETTGLAADSCPVTGVATAKALQRALRRVVRQVDAPGGGEAGARDPGCCFLVVDLDRFAAFNRRHGRRIGDLVLKTTARQLATAMKRGDAIGRLDGAVFGIVLAGTDLAGGEALAERLRQMAASRPLELGAGPAELAPVAAIEPVTLSIGVAAYHRGEPLHRLVGRADRARQLAKTDGGNRVVSERATAVVGRPKA